MDERTRALLAAMTEIVRAPGAEAAFAADPVGFLVHAGLAREDAEALAALGPRRLFVYRRHVRKTLARGVRRQIPRTAARLGEAYAGWIDRFIEAEGSRSRYFRDVAFEAVAWAAPRWAEDPEVPAFLGDLARHELSLFDAGTAPPDPAEGEAPGEITLDRPLRFAGAVRLATYTYAVHRLSAAEEARDVPDREETALLYYRDAEDEVRVLALTPLAAATLGRLLAGAALGAAVVEGAAALGVPVDGAVTGSAATLLDDLRARGALLGGAP